MAITLDQFLRDFTEGQLLSAEEAQAFRRQLTKNAERQPRDHRAAGRSPTQAGLVALEAPSVSPILSDCLVLEKIHQDQRRLTFSARRLKNNAPAVLHIFPFPSDQESPSPPTSPHTPPPAEGSDWDQLAIVDVGRHGPLIALCCEKRKADTLADVIAENGPLPGELTGECLLQIVQSVKRFCEQGIALNALTPEDLLLDDEGRVYVSAHQLDHFSASEACRRDDHALPMEGMLKSLGKIFHFLRTGGQYEQALDQNGTGPTEREASASANLIEARLFGHDSAFRYESWNRMIDDLKTLLAGEEESAETATQPAAPDETSSREEAEPVSDLPVPATKPAPRKKTSALFKPWMMLALAFATLGGAVFVALALLNK